MMVSVRVLLKKDLGKKGEMLTPGERVLMRMPWTPISCAMDLQSWWTAALLVL